MTRRRSARDSICARARRRWRSTAFNRDLLTTWGEKSLFDVVNDGEWTLDYQIRLGKQYYSDNDGSSSVTKGDTVGMISSTLSYIAPYWSSCKNPILTKTDDNWYDYSIDVDRLSTTLRKVTELFYDANSYIVTSGSDSERLNEIGRHGRDRNAAPLRVRDRISARYEGQIRRDPLPEA